MSIVSTDGPVHREPARFLTFNGDQSHMVGEVKGPNLLGEWVTAVTAEYDPATNLTRVGFAFGILVRRSELTP